MQAALEALRGHQAKGISSLLRSLLSDKTFINPDTSKLQETAAELLVRLRTPEAQAFAVSLKDDYKHKFVEYSFRAAVQSLSPSDVYEQFWTFFTEGKEAAGKRLFQAFHDVVPPLYHRMMAENPPEMPEMDPRWISIFIQMDAAELVTRLAQTPDRKVVNYLKSKCEEKIGYGNDVTIHAFYALFHIGYKEAPELLAKTITPETYDMYYYFYEPHVNLLKMLPASYAEWLAKFADEHVKSESVRKHLREVAEFIGTKPVEPEEDQKGWVKWVKNKMF